LSSKNGGCDHKNQAKDSKPFGCESKQKYTLLKEHLEEAIPTLPKHHLVEIRKLVTEQFRKRFQRSRIPKYGALNKGFTELELQKFFRTIDNDKFHLLFSYQAQLGLRIGEAAKINIKDIKFESRELVVKTEKAMTLDMLLIPTPLFQATINFIKINQSQIEEADGYLFFKEQGKSRTNSPYLDLGYVRNCFRYYTVKAGLSEVYDTSDESVQARIPRNLHRLTTHSLRHYAITHFAEQTNGNVFLTSKFARHSKPDMTMTYISTNKKALYEGIDSAFSVSQVQSLKRLLLNRDA
jgi:integrase